MRHHSPGSVRVTRVELSIGSLDLFRFDDYDHAFPRHSHDRFTLGVFGSGNGSIRMNGSYWKANDGCILAIPPDAAHSAEPSREHGWTYRTLYPSQELMRAAFDADIEIVFRNPIIDDDCAAMRVSWLHHQLETRGASLDVEEQLLDVFRHIVVRHAAMEGAADHEPSGVIARARAYIDENFSKPVKLADLSSLCDLSPFQLIRSFRRVAGMTPHAYLTQVRANRAREMLIGGDGISTIAYRCGFSDQSHLTRTFKKIFGVTPGTYVSAAGRGAAR